ncbi:nuclear transport factor 2 family protein [Gordonia terrae]|uniref:Nuclear transport factor 2 family protein n=2 Tax=Gordonia terrae TaxID=2055 RepID=A0AAD0NX26_9ACTN|nr:nuclear transport factor 2 family protein [Gordonia terrae]VTR06839.1 Uncharacterised protein [Clostridioides difficile]ANY22536.1 gamma-BHC dehydrochlorinase [Gordonia terrae]AWO83273.1 nuclear transport factor 2 family protein [Gordonia terrae]VTS36718.1 Uncharacterised protein [Gordonia terrae]GAB43381.1 hypothetical protein GOTRE_039_02220 [Gordonia terrae NBRC 100016]
MSTADARLAIQDALYTYARGVDRLDFDLIRSCYHPGAVDDHGGYVGDVEGLIDDIRQRHETIDSSQHLMLNIMIEFDSDTSALVESHCLVFMRWFPEVDGGPQRRRTVRARLIDRFELRAGQWKTARRVVAFEESVEDDVVDLVGPTWTRSTRDRTDPLYRLQELSER